MGGNHLILWKFVPFSTCYLPSTVVEAVKKSCLLSVSQIHSHSQNGYKTTFLPQLDGSKTVKTDIHTSFFPACKWRLGFFKNGSWMFLWIALIFFNKFMDFFCFFGMADFWSLSNFRERLDLWDCESIELNKFLIVQLQNTHMFSISCDIMLFFNFFGQKGGKHDVHSKKPKTT